MTVKKFIGQIHLWLGLASGLIVMVVTLTGATLVFEKELDEWINHRFYYAEAASTPRLPLDSLVQRATSYDREWTLLNMQFGTGEPLRNVLFAGKKKQSTWVISVNPFSGDVVQMVNYDTRFFTVVLKLHRYLLMKDTGKVITGISCLMFLSIILTGLVLWWPKRIKMLRQRMSIGWKNKFKRLNWDLHAVGGFYIHLVIFIIALTGLTWSYTWFNNGIYKLFDGRPPKKMEVPTNTVKRSALPGFFETLYTDANRQLSYKGRMIITIPAKDSLAITVFKENDEAAFPNTADFLYYEKGSGRLLKKRLYKDESRGMKVRRMIYPIHTGSIFGWPTKILAFGSVLFAASLPVTGLLIWLGRKKKKKRSPLLAVKAPLAVKEQVC
jgi:uncharacterized iron-regulated membrane protein